MQNLRLLAGCGAASNLALTAYQAIIIVFLVREVGLGGGAIGLLLSVGSVGGVLGAMLVTRCAGGSGRPGRCCCASPAPGRARC